MLFLMLGDKYISRKRQCIEMGCPVAQSMRSKMGMNDETMSDEQGGYDYTSVSLQFIL